MCRDTINYASDICAWLCPLGKANKKSPKSLMEEFRAQHLSSVQLSWLPGQHSLLFTGDDATHGLPAPSSLLLATLSHFAAWQIVCRQGQHDMLMNMHLAEALIKMMMMTEGSLK